MPSKKPNATPPTRHGRKPPRRGGESRRVVSAPGTAPASKAVRGSPAWLDFLERLDAARDHLGYPRDWSGTTECYFRGEYDEHFHLTPSLFRTTVPKEVHAKDYWYELESDFFFEFRARARETHGLVMSSWDVLFAMQHYGVPTRLLDWTEVFGVALFFALDGYVARPTGAAPDAPEVNPAIWVMNPYRLNQWAWTPEDDGIEQDLIAPRILGWDESEKTYYDYDELLLEDAIDWAHPVALYPEKRNARLHIQRASFTIHGHDTRPLNVQLDEDMKNASHILQKIPLPKAAIPDALRFLRQAGISRSQIYPELDGLAQDMRQKYGLRKSLV